MLYVVLAYGQEEGLVVHELLWTGNTHLLSPLFSTSRERDRALAQSLAPPILPPAKADLPRFTGGGFNLKQSQKAAA